MPQRQWLRSLSLGALAGLLALAATRAAADNETSEARMRKDVTYLASPECEGRGVDTEGINKAADYIADQFKKAGLKPGGPKGSYFQPFTISVGVSKLKGPAKWTYYYLYVILDVFSRYAVGWTVQHRESGPIAQALIGQAAAQQRISRDQLTVHADRGVMESAVKERGDMKIFAVTVLTSTSQADLAEQGYTAKLEDLVLKRAAAAAELKCDGIIPSGLEVAGIKAKFGASLKGKNRTAQINEALCKVLCHNICCLIQSMFEFGIQPTFSAE